MNKKTLCILALSCIIQASCKKDNEPITPSEEDTFRAVYDVSTIFDSKNKESLTVKWKNKPSDSLLYTELKICSWKSCKTVKCSPSNTSYSLTDTIYGMPYDFSLTNVYDKGARSKSVEYFCHYWDQGSIPDIPMLYVISENFTDPTYDIIETPPDCWGGTITNNNYVNCRVLLSNCNQKQYDSGSGTESFGARIKIRGNWSARLPKKPYKIKLDSKVDLLGNGVVDDEYIILKYDELKYAVGSTLARFMRDEWQPQYKYANVVLNGDYKGLYLIINAIGKGKDKINITNNGYIIENDAYWWKPNETYFKGEYIRNEFGYTFKYPSKDKLTQENIDAITDRVVNMEREIRSEPMNIDAIDVKSFTTWILVHDILGTNDGAGSNMYMYITDVNQPDAKFHMGPMWDFDTLYQSGDNWAEIHNRDFFYYVRLLKNDKIKLKYTMTFYSKQSSILNVILAELTDISGSIGPALSESINKDNERWNYKLETLNESISKTLNWINNRLPWIRSNISQL